MCGIILAVNREQNIVNQQVIDQLENQKSRGTEGFGIALVNNHYKLDKITRSTEIAKTLLDLYLNPRSMVLLHHRTPTSSSNRLSQTHPFVVKHGSLKYKYLVVVNGHVYNHQEIKKTHQEELGYIYTTDDKDKHGKAEYNDCEALAWELARYLEKQIEEIGSRGSYAFIALKINDKEQIEETYFGTNADTACPLKLGANEREIFISSEGKGEPIKEDILYSFNTTDFKIKKKGLKIAKVTYISSNNYKDDDDDYCGYRHYNTNKTTDKKEETKIDKTKEEDDLVDLAMESADESLATFFNTLDITMAPKDMLESMEKCLSEISTEMLEAYYCIIGANREQILDDVTSEIETKVEEDQQKVMDLAFEDRCFAR